MSFSISSANRSHRAITSSRYCLSQRVVASASSPRARAAAVRCDSTRSVALPMTTSPKSRQNCPRPPNFPFAAPGPIGPSPNPVGRPPAKSVPKARATRAGSQSAPLLGSAVGRPPVSIGQTAMVHPEDCGYRRGRCIPKVYHWSSAPPIRCWRIATSRALAIICQRTVPVGVKKPSFPRDGRCCTVAAVQRGRDTAGIRCR